MESRANRPHFIRSTTREKNVLVQNKQKMIILILRKIVNKQLKKSFRIVKQSVRESQYAIKIVEAKSNKNIKACKELAWKKLMLQSKLNARKLETLKKTLSLNTNLQKRILARAFLRITRFGYQKSIKQSDYLLKTRNKILFILLKNLYSKKLSQSFTKIIYFKKDRQKILSGLTKLNIIFRETEEKNKLRGWAKLCRSSAAEQKDIEYELGEVMKEVDLLRKQLSVKRQENEDLFTKLQVREQNARYKTISDIQTNGRGSARSVDAKKSLSVDKRRSLSNEKEDKKSDTGSQQSVLSWINNSFLSFKSGKSSKAMSGVECFCVYRQKYNQYKYQSISLKNQLQIIKNELQVTKDVNEHLQQEISNFYGAQDNSFELQRLRKECKELRKQRDSLKDKMYKYQKYVANLKIEFKNKIESLYRNIKKNQ